MATSFVNADVSSGCSGGAGFFEISSVFGGTGTYTAQLRYYGSSSIEAEYALFQASDLPLRFDGLGDTLYLVTIFDSTDASNADERRQSFTCAGTGGGGSTPLTLTASTTDETAAGGDGTITLLPDGGSAPLLVEVVELGLSRPATAGTSELFSAIPASTYTVRATDASGQVVTRTVTVGPYVAAKVGCQDEYATDYDPAATSPGACTYAVNWRSAWGPTGLAVAVPALPGQVKAYTEANLRIGFRPGHPLATDRPLGAPVRLRATVGPDGYARFVLGPYLRPQLGAPDGAAGYRLDLNSLTALTDDLFVGYELRRTTGELLEHGYALNSAVPDSQIVGGQVLSPFAPLPVWPGLDYQVSQLGELSAGRYGTVEALDARPLDPIRLACPPNPLPVRWLAKGGGFGYWAFQGRPQIGDEVGESQAYNEAGSGERRYSQRGEARGTVTASTGTFNGPQFAEGLRTLWASTQVWLLRGEEWVAVTMEGGSFPVRRMGLPRTEITVTFTEARPHYAQGQ